MYVILKMYDLVYCIDWQKQENRLYLKLTIKMIMAAV